jgi:Tetratricopeptide repeat
LSHKYGNFIKGKSHYFYKYHIKYPSFMKSATFFISIYACLVISACSQKTSAPEAQNVYLTPEVMCGTVQFTDGCSPKTDTLIRFGLALIHHMTYEDAGYTFDQVLKEDPDCFWGHWGKSMAYIHPLWPDIPTEKEMESGFIHTQKALALAKNDKEKLYGEALAAYFEKGTKTKPERMAMFQQGLAKATEQLPDDPEIALFNGLYRLAIVSPADKSFTVQKEVGELAEKYLAMYPDHPGAFHYAIHAYDVPPLASKALAVARSYGKIAPEIPHALHMPSHIFTRLGYWQESIEWNARSAKAAARLPYHGEVSPHMFHALDYEVYALLQLGEDKTAKEIKASFDTITAPLHVNGAAAYALAAIPARIPLEDHHWDEAAAIPLPDTSYFPWKKFPQWEALTHYARGLGAARSGKADIAQSSLTRMMDLQKALGDAPATKYWYDQMEAQMTVIKSWMAYGAGNKEEGLALLKQAADLEDSTVKNPVSPGELLPARELLGDMLIEMKNPKEALMAYEKSLESRPNRFNSLYGAGLAAEASGDMNKAKAYFTRVLELKGATASSRERLDHARKVANPV